ncbi:rho guanine nucleotide exchange factor 2-like isoform X2 [Photinus pyralis]|uniref:rho guanine nucleotide exchange factor 2-like isoform X2 n=1 Tax=Photinus pyralis TaxID=7054 RepID=UPI001267712A|nr:rho guanine nucleotide exchange factor 2-like isoform X2 [Photinus pyralis]
MWSTQTETSNKNMTSLKSKITHRKRKNSKSKSSNAQSVESNLSANTQTLKKPHNRTRKNSTGSQKSGPNRKNQPDLIENLKPDHNKISTADPPCNGDDDIQLRHGGDADFRAELLSADVWLENNDDASLNNNTKRYSDSFVIRSKTSENFSAESRQSLNHLAQSEFFEDKSERKSRRFSDIFRYGALKPSISCENIKTAIKMKPPEEFPGVNLRKKPPAQESASSADMEKKSKKVTKNDKGKKAAPVVSKKVEPQNDSYLKRVKSKIYKTKSDNTTNGLPTMPNIAEDTKTTKKSKKKKPPPTTVQQPEPSPVPELRKSVSQFDFRLIRQTSNLERIRPKTFGLRTASSNLGISDLCDSPEKPVLAKSKSSSAINLNLLRTRRNKLLEQAKRNCKIVRNEFDFIGFNGSTTTLVAADDETDGQDAGETKPGHPVSRTGSDRRPDAVREEASRTQESQENVDQHETDLAHPDSTVSLPAYTGNKKRAATNINRSESVKEQSEKRKQRRNISDPLHNTTNETVDLDQHGLSYQTHSGSSSNSSLSSSRSSESPSTSLDAVSSFPTAHPAGTGWDSDMEIDADPSDWQSSVPEDELANLSPHERKRQDVINELFHTERSHVRNLWVLENLFKKPLQLSKLLKNEEINLIFPNLGDLLEIHSQLNTTMKNKRKENPVIKDIGDMLLNMFDGVVGENFQAGAAAFCERQQLALEFIKERRKKESRFDSFLSDHEKHPLCRRLPLQGIIPTEMQRLSKYPLLLERLIHIEEKHRQRDPDAALVELQKLRLAHDRSKEIVNYVNEAAKIACNRARLEDIQRHLDTSIFEKTDHAIVNEFKNVDLTRYSLIHEGTMHLRRPNKQPVALHIVLLEEAVILLQKDAERYVLKFFQAGTPTQQPLAPIIKTSTLLVRANAASKSSLFLVNTSSQNSQMYDLLARDSSERDTWFKHISDAAEAYNRREGKSKRCEPTPDTDDSETLQDLPSVRDVSERADHVGGDVASATDSDSCGPSGESSNRNSDVIDEERDKMLSQSDSEGTNTNVVGGGVMLKVAADDWPLVQPTEVHISVLPVHKAEPVLTPFEQIRRKDEEVRRALSDKEGLVADLLSIPREDYQLIADIASDEAYKKAAIDREPAEVVLAALFQADQLLAAVNDSLNVSEADAAWVAGGKFSSCASNEGSAKQNNHVPSVPVHRLQGIATTLSTQLTTLLSIIKDRDEERDRLRRELQRTREQLHEKLSLHGPTPENPENDSSQPGDLESIEESPTENDN